MVVFALHLRDDVEAIELKDLPNYKLKADLKVELQIARHLARVLKQHGHPAALYLPPALALADFYHCPILEVLKGLQVFKKQGHDYKLHALDTEVSLYDANNKHQPVTYSKFRY